MKFHSSKSNAFSKSSKTRRPGILSLYVFSIKSETNLLQSPIYLPFIKPDCDSEISLLCTAFILAAIADDPILRSTVNSEIMLQFFKYSCFFSFLWYACNKYLFWGYK